MLWSPKALASHRKEAHLVSPLLGRRRGPDEYQVVDDAPHRIALVHHEQPRHWESIFDSGKGWGGHGVHVVRDDDEFFPGRIFQYLVIWTFIEAHLPYANHSNTRSRRRTPSTMCSLRSCSARNSGRLMILWRRPPSVGLVADQQRDSVVQRSCLANDPTPSLVAGGTPSPLRHAKGST